MQPLETKNGVFGIRLRYSKNLILLRNSGKWQRFFDTRDFSKLMSFPEFPIWLMYTRERNDFPCLRGLFDTMRRQVSLTYY